MRLKRPCPLPETNLLRILPVLYINFELLKNKWDDSRTQDDVSRLQPLQNYNLIKFAIIRPSTLNHDRNLWNCRVAPDETTYLTGFFRCPSALALIWTKLFNVCVNKLSLSIDTRHQWLAPPEKILGYATAHEPKSRTPRDPFGVSHWYSRLTNPKSKQKSRTTIYLPLPCFSRKCRCYARAPLRIFASPSLRPRP